MQRKRILTKLVKWRYLVALIAVVGITFIRAILGTQLAQGAPLVLYLIAVTLSAVIGGFGVGIFATLLSATIASYLFLQPMFSIAIVGTREQVHFTAFLIEGLLISVICGQFQKANRKLSESEARFRKIFEFADVGIGELDVETMKFTNANQKLICITGYSAEELALLTPYDITHPDDRAECLAKFDQLMSGQLSQFTIEKRFIRKNGELVWMRNNVSFMEGRNGEQKTIIGILHDVTAQKRVADDLLQAKLEAESSNTAKSLFLANMSHEIRTPLGAIMGFSELVTDPRVNEAEKLNYVAAIKRNGELLTNIINDILDLSRVEAGKLEVEIRECSLAEILNDTQTLLDRVAKNSGAALSFVRAENIPDTIKTDPLRLRQILLNLIGNALKFAAQGSVVVSVRQTEKNNKRLLEFAVTDDGIGISPEQTAKLFVPFSQIDASSRRQQGGAGLGLVLSRRIAELLGGGVELTASRPGSGSTFTVTIDPEKQINIQKISAAPRDVATQSDSTPIRLDGWRILLAEDSPDNQLLVSHILRLGGAKVDIARNGEVAMKKAQADHYDVILMDIQMPVLDGFETTERLRQNGYKGKIIALTAHAMDEEKKKCFAMGFDDHIAKPIDKELLLKKVSQCGG